MAQEIELKLGVAPAAIRKVAQLPWLRSAADGSTRREKLVSVYFDTPKLRLRKKGVALRVRHIGEKRIQTVKVIQKGGRGAFGRDEWEQPIDGDTPDLSLAKDTALAPLITKRLRRKLQPVFETVVERTTLPVRAGGTSMEVAVDRGRIEVAGRQEPISEVEIELKRGDPIELTGIAQQLANSLPVAYHPRAKQDRGYALLMDEAGSAVHPTEIHLDPRYPAAEAFRVIALSCLDHALANEQAVRAGDAEGIHQMRVGLRRLRAALSLFKELVQGPEAEAVKTELKWLTDQLGSARELDVLINKRIDPARETTPFAEIGVLAKNLGDERHAAFNKAAQVIQSDRYRALGLKTALWIFDGEWSRSLDPMLAAKRARSAADFAAEILTRRLGKILKKAGRMEKLSPRRRHKLRIAVKKLRYATGFFASLFPSPKRVTRRRRFAKELRALQNAIGTLNDLEAHKRIAATITRPRRRDRNQPQKALAIGFITGQEHVQTAGCLRAATEAAHKLAKTSTFWE
jgi:triphosphatase